jgi:hypothetical protein
MASWNAARLGLRQSGKLSAVRLRNPGEIERAMRVLSDLQGRVMHCRGYDDTVQYLSWCGEASRQFREQFVSPELAELAERDQRDLTLGATTMTRVREFLDRNIDIWQARLVEARARLEALGPFIERPGQLVVVDTSAFIEGEYFTSFSWRQLAGVQAEGPIRLIVPIIVIDELDDLKRDRRAGDRARSVLHRLHELHGAAPFESAELPGRQGVAVEVFLDDPSHQRLLITMPRSSTGRRMSANWPGGRFCWSPETSGCFTGLPQRALAPHSCRGAGQRSPAS